MKRSEWPTSVDVNMFIVAKLDPAVLPTDIKVVTWSNLFGEGGSVSIDADMPRGVTPGRVTLASIRRNSNGSVAAERKHLERLLNDWRTDDLAADWSGLIAKARADVRAYYADKLAEYGLRLADEESA